MWGGGGGGGVKALLQLANFTLGPDATLNTRTHKNSVRIKAPNSVNALHQGENIKIKLITTLNKEEYSWLILLCQSKWKPIVEPRRANPKAVYRQAPTHWLKKR